MKPTDEKKQISEGILTNFIEKFFDAYQKGIDKQFIDIARKREPMLAKSLEDLSASLTKTMEIIKNRKYDS
jgi:predicted P-loop ATPase/GTPase